MIFPRLYTKKVVRGLAVIATLLWAGVLALGAVDYLQAMSGEKIPTPEIVTSVTGQPSENKPVVDDSYTVPDTQPRVVAVAKLGVTAYIQRVGIDNLGAIATPSNIHFAGWYIHSKLPGEKGVSIIDGHVGGRFTPGVFERLHELTTGDVVAIQFGNKSWKEFNVTNVASYKEEDALQPLMKDADGSATLRLITCSGEYNAKTQTYSHRTIVTTVLK